MLMDPTVDLDYKSKVSIPGFLHVVGCSLIGRIVQARGGLVSSVVLLYLFQAHALNLSSCSNYSSWCIQLLSALKNHYDAHMNMSASVQTSANHVPRIFTVRF